MADDKFVKELERYTRSYHIPVWKIENDASNLRYQKKKGLNERKYLEMTANKKR